MRLELPMILSNRFSEALTYAAELHATQIRKGSGVPALLHDAIEDQGGPPTREAIRRRFGDTVTAIVDGCTDSDATPKPPWRDRKQAYIDRILTASSSVRLVSAADKLYNVRSILKDSRLVGDSVWERFKGGKDGSFWYYRSLVEAFRQAESTPLVEELDRTLLELEQFSKG